MSTAGHDQPERGVKSEVTVTEPLTSQPIHTKQPRLLGVNKFFVEKGPAITALALFLSLLQLVLAWWGADDVRKIADSVSTQYVDVFPQNMPKIEELINRTESSLTIITDVAAYGHFSSPSNSDKYRRALEALNAPDRNIRIEILCYDSPTGTNKLREQFAITDFQQYRKEREETFTTYARWHQGWEPQNPEELYTAIIQAGEDMLKRLGSNATTRIVRTSADLPLFMWIRDDKEAIFSLHNYGQSPREDSFRTTDGRFIARLKDIAKAEFERKKHPSSVPPTSAPPVSATAQPSPAPTTATVQSPTP